MRHCTSIALVMSLLVAMAACGGPGDEAPEVDAGTGPAAVSPGEEPEPLLSSLDDLPAELAQLLAPWTGDLEGMVERRAVRVLTAHNPMFYFLDGAEQRGIVYEGSVLFEDFLNEHLERGRLRARVIIIPVRRDDLLPALVEGRGDLVIANLTITPERREIVDFSTPVMRDVSEVVITGPSFPPVTRLEDLAGRELRLRRSSSYWASVEALNKTFVERGLEPVRLTAASPYLEDHDLIEMVNAGLLDLTIADSHKAEFWAKVFGGVVVHPDLAVREGGEIGWAFRKNSPGMREVVDLFVRKHRKGTLTGNVLYNRYLGDTSWVKNAYDENERKRFHDTAVHFQKYGDLYEFDWVLLAAQGYQESRLEQSTRSRAGAIGVMQLMPTAAKQVGIQKIDDLENNVHAGTKYMRHLVDHYFDDPSLSPEERHMLALAAYNAGPTRIKKLRQETAAKGLDPNVWFDNVEVVVARRVGSEPVRYVSNIVKYYYAYKLLLESRQTGDSG